MNLELTDEQAAALLKGPDNITRPSHSAKSTAVDPKRSSKSQQAAL
jgi:hypothetical protein